MSDIKGEHIFPARICAQDWERLRSFIQQVSDLARAMNVQVSAINPENEEDLQVLMKLIGATGYEGTFKLKDPKLRQKVKKATAVRDD